MDKVFPIKDQIGSLDVFSSDMTNITNTAQYDTMKNFPTQAAFVASSITKRKNMLWDTSQASGSEGIWYATIP